MSGKKKRYAEGGTVGMSENRQGSSSLLKLLDDLYVGGLPSAEPQPTIDQMQMPPKKALIPDELADEEDEDESINPPVNIMGSY